LKLEPMSRVEILIDRAGPLVRAAVVDDGRLIDLQIDRADRPSQVGDIVLGRVDRIVTALNAAFIDIGGPTAGFLGASDLRQPGAASRKEARAGSARIGTRLRTGQPVLVQVRADAVGDKGAALTMDVTLPGRFLVLAPFAPGIVLSRRLAQGEARGRLTTLVAGLTAGLTRAPAGWIVRAGALDAPAERLSAEAEGLAMAWRAVEAAAEAGPAPRVLRTGASAALRTVIEQGGRPLDRIIVGDPACHAELTEWCTQAAPDLADRIERYDGGARPLFERYDLDGEIARLIGRRVPLPGGGSLVIDRTEALTVIDVNGGERPNVLATNLDAAAEIARQLRLRSVGGIVIVDFINMADRRDQQRVLDALAQAVAGDPAATHVYGMSKLGLVELTRARRGPALADLLRPGLPTDTEIS
jgi:ribonuclease G